MRLVTTSRGPSAPRPKLRRSFEATRWLAATALGVSVLFGSTASFADPDAFDPTRVAPQVLYNYGETETPRSAAMGGALRSLGSGTSAPYLNPADLASAHLYHVEAQAQISPETGRQLYGGTIVDSSTSKMAGAATFNIGWMDTSRADISVLDARAAMAYPVTDHFFIGLGGRYLKLGENGKNAPFGTSDKVAGGLIDPTSTTSPAGRVSSVNTLTFDVGLTAKLGDYVYLSAVGQNLTYPNNGFLPTTVGGGFGVGNSDFSLEVDGIADLNSWGKPTARIMAGAEFLAGDHVPLRLGYRYDEGAKLNILSGGLGYIGQLFSFEGSVKRTISSPGVTTLVFSIAYFIDAAGDTHATPTLDDPHDGALQ